jgi:hypothetical protein
MHVQDVMVDGAWLLRNTEWMTIDHAAVCADLEEAFSELMTRKPA